MKFLQRKILRTAKKVVQLYIKPFVGWLWAGALFMFLGGWLAALGLRRQGEMKA